MPADNSSSSSRSDTPAADGLSASITPSGSSEAHSASNTEATVAKAAASLWKETPHDAITDILERDNQAKAAAQRKQAAAQAKIASKMVSITLTIWSQVCLYAILYISIFSV